MARIPNGMFLGDDKKRRSSTIEEENQKVYFSSPSIHMNEGKSFHESLRQARRVLMSHDGAVLRALTRNVSKAVTFCHVCKEFIFVEDVMRTIVNDFLVEPAICDVCGWCCCQEHTGEITIGGGYCQDDEQLPMEVSMRRCISCPSEHMLCDDCHRGELFPCKNE